MVTSQCKIGTEMLPHVVLLSKMDKEFSIHEFLFLGDLACYRTEPLSVANSWMEMIHVWSPFIFCAPKVNTVSNIIMLQKGSTAQLYNHNLYLNLNLDINDHELCCTQLMLQKKYIVCPGL